MIPAVLATVLFATNAAAQNTMMLFPLKDASCGTWISLASDASGSRHIVAAWAAGFISGYNWFNNTNQVTRDLRDETITAYIDKHCRDNPLHGIARAVMELEVISKPV
jgi:hypothetical protein